MKQEKSVEQPDDDWGQEPEWADDDMELEADDDELEDAIDSCGQINARDGGGCMLAGTEYCDFECPFRNEMYREMNRNRDSKGRFCKTSPPCSPKTD